MQTKTSIYLTRTSNLHVSQPLRILEGRLCGGRSPPYPPCGRAQMVISTTKINNNHNLTINKQYNNESCSGQHTHTHTYINKYKRYLV